MSLSEARGRGQIFRIASALFFLSGASGLAYEVIWFKRFSHIWGNSTLAMASVVASFLFGLGVGANRVGGIADRVRSQLFWYGIFEIGIGLLAIGIPFETGWLLQPSSVLYGQLQDRPLLHSFARFAFTLVIIGPPCFLMGGTLPLLIRQFTSATEALNRSTAWFYAINTLGAATGCYITGFHLLPSFGLAWTNGMAATLNLLIGGAAIVVSQKRPSREPIPASGSRAERARPARSAEATHAPSRIALYSAAALSGCAALILQMVWSRQLALVLGGSTYAFTAMLFVVLVGIGVGSLATHFWLRTSSADLGQALVFVILGLVLSTMASERAIPHLTYVVGLVSPLRNSQSFNALLSVAASSGLELLPALGMGILFPIFVHMTRASAANAGSTVGNVYAWNTMGTMVGASLTSLWLIPTWGAARAVNFALALYYAAGLATILRSGSLDMRVSQALLAVLAAIMFLLPASESDTLVTNAGMYMYGYTAPERIHAQEKLLYFKEGSSVNVVVADRGDVRVLRVNGKIDANNRGDMEMQLGLAYFPRFLLPAAKKTLVIGFGSGTTSGASLLFPDSEVRCLEIEPAVFEASKQFSATNHKPESSERFSIVFDDGRSYLQGTEERYDLILSEPSNPWLAGVSNLFTREFYEAARVRLKDNGILAQWLQMYSFSSAEYALVARTVMSVFPHYAVIRISDGDTILLASRSPLSPTKESVRTAQSLTDSLPLVRADLTKYFGSSDVLSLLLTHMILDETAVRRLAANAGSDVINSDLNMRLEFDAPRRLFDPQTGETEDVMKTILSAADPAAFDQAFERWGGSAEQATAFRDLARIHASKGRQIPAMQIIDAGLRRSPSQADLLGDRLIVAPTADSAAFESGLRALLSSSVARANQVGVVLWQQKRFAQAAIVFEQVVRASPQAASSWNYLALAYQYLGQREKAREAFGKAIALDPANDSLEQTFKAFESQQPKS